jgi:hypothetical protein
MGQGMPFLPDDPAQSPIKEERDAATPIALLTVPYISSFKFDFVSTPLNET